MRTLDWEIDLRDTPAAPFYMSLHALSDQLPQQNGRRMPLISVITATYNALDGLRGTVESVREQTLDGIEHVIVDGGSTDGTVEYLRSLGDTVRWVSEPDEGIADAMNKGVAMARGQYVLFIHADDTLRGADVLSDVLAEGFGQDLISGQVVLIEKDGAERLRKVRNLGLLTELRMTSPHQGLLTRKDLFEMIGGFDKKFRIAMDYDFLIRAKRAGASFRSK